MLELLEVLHFHVTMNSCGLPGRPGMALHSTLQLLRLQIPHPGAQGHSRSSPEGLTI